MLPLISFIGLNVLSECLLPLFYSQYQTIDSVAQYENIPFLPPARHLANLFDQLAEHSCIEIPRPALRYLHAHTSSALSQPYDITMHVYFSNPIAPSLPYQSPHRLIPPLPSFSSLSFPPLPSLPSLPSFSLSQLPSTCFVHTRHSTVV